MASKYQLFGRRIAVTEMNGDHKVSSGMLQGGRAMLSEKDFAKLAQAVLDNRKMYGGKPTPGWSNKQLIEMMEQAGVDVVSAM